jgi:hypothetical protein
MRTDSNIKISFIVPNDGGDHTPLERNKQCRLFPPAGLARMAGLAGKRGTVKLVDERRASSARIDYDSDVAVIFINIYNQQRAYEVANKYLAHGAHVVFTGPALANLSREASVYADSLFLGESKDCMKRFLADLAANKPKRFYTAKLNPASRQRAQAPAAVRASFSLAS